MWFLRTDGRVQIAFEGETQGVKETRTIRTSLAKEDAKTYLGKVKHDIGEQLRDSSIQANLCAR